MTLPVRPNIARMRGYTPGEQPTDPAVIKLNTNENPYPPSPRAMQAIAAVGAEQLRRYPSPDARAFREAASAALGVAPDEIIATNGGDELLALAVRAAAGDGATVAYTTPSYSLYPVLADMQNCRHLEVPFAISPGQWRLPEDAFDALEGKAAVLLITNPNAPSGTLIALHALERALERFRGLVVVDEAYVDFAAASALPLVRHYPHLLLLRSMSKGYALAGLRFGFGVGNTALLRELNKVRDSYPCDALAIAAAAAAIADQPYARESWRKVCEARAALAASLSAMGFTVPESHANFVLATVPAGADAAAVYEALKARNILVRYFNMPHLSDALRITVGTPEQNQRLLGALAEILTPARTQELR